MLFDLHQNSDDIQKQHYTNLKLLKGFAKLSIIDKQLPKDNFLSLCHDFSLQLDWDSIFGGHFNLSAENITFSLENNILLTDLFLACGQTFYQGRFNFLATNILEGIKQHFYRAENNLCVNQKSYCIDKVPFRLKLNELKKILTLDEVKLLQNLLPKNPLNNEEKLFINYKFELSVAAEKSNFHYKQAQIYEESINSKLKAHTNNLYLLGTLGCDFDLVNNSQLLSVLVKHYLWTKSELHFKWLVSLQSHLSNTLFDANDSLTQEQLIAMIYALIDYCQVKFDHQFIAQILLCLKKLERTFDDSLPHLFITKMHLERTLIILQKLTLISIEKSKITYPKLSTFIHTCNFNSQLNIHILTGSSSQVEDIKSELYSCYDPDLKVFQIHYK